MKASKYFLGLALLWWTLPGEAQNARNIIEQSTKAIEFSSLEMTSSLQINDGKGNNRGRQVSNVTKQFGSVTKTFIRFLAPADVKGTSMLIYDYEQKPDDIWIYLPALRKSRRIISSERGKSFMGSEFSNADMSKPNLDDYAFTLIGSEKVNNADCWMVEFKPKTKPIADENGFGRKVSFVDKNTSLTQKSDYYNHSGQLFKTLVFNNYRLQTDGKYFSFRMTMTNHLNKRYSEIIVDSFKPGTNVGESFFSVSELEK